MSKNPYRIAISGLGTVGLGFVDLLQKNADLMTGRAGRQIEIVGINARNRTKDRGLDLSCYPWIDDPMDLPDLEGVDGVVELIGGDSGSALALARKTLNAGKDLITANKAMLAIHGTELAGLAEQNGATIAYEAAVAGAIPAIKVVRESLAGNQIHKIGGILNGTCNYILSAMESTGAAYGDVLKEAQDLGYAESDPTTDVGGFDSAHKLTLLAAIAFGHCPKFDACDVSGIDGVSDVALTYAERLGYRIRLIGLALPGGNASKMIVEPMAVPIDSPLGGVTGSHNAVQIISDQAGQIFLRGPGAGRAQTASAVAGDVIDLARGHVRPTFGLPITTLLNGEICQSERTGFEDVEARLCILRIKDEPGAMAAVTQVLAMHGVSVDQLMQPGGHDGHADVAMITYPGDPNKLRSALVELGGQSYMTAPVESYRIEHFSA